MSNLKNFFKYACLAIVVQVVIWLIFGRWDPFVEKFIYLYYPTIKMVESMGNFMGDANIIVPIWIGVPLGILLYSIIFAAILTFVMKR